MIKDYYPKSGRGFTLIEILVAVAIIGVVASLSVIALSVARTESRDTKRINDIAQMRSALEMYFADHGTYPLTGAFVPGSVFEDASTTKVYLKSVPRNPISLIGADCSSFSDYEYSQRSGGASYSLEYCLENGSDNIPAGISTATPSSLSSNNPFACVPACATGLECLDGRCIYPECPVSVCGDCEDLVCGDTCNTTVRREGASVAESYSTKLIGQQCWLTENINIGTMDTIHIMAAADPYTEVSRYCYSDSSGNCDSSPYDGGLYNWAMAMYLPGSFNQSEFVDYNDVDLLAKRQGLCPKGWHIPSDYEWTIMEHALDPVVPPAVKSKWCGTSANSFYADNICSNTASSTNLRGTDGNWITAIAPRLYCLGSGDPYSGCLIPGAGLNIPLAGYRDSSAFANRSSNASLWSSSQGSPTNAWYRFYSTASTQGGRNINLKSGLAYSIRCVQD